MKKDGQPRSQFGFQKFLEALNEELVVNGVKALLSPFVLVWIPVEKMKWVRWLIAFHFDKSLFEELLECIRESVRECGDTAPFAVEALDMYRFLPDVGYAIGDAVLEVPLPSKVEMLSLLS